MHHLQDFLLWSRVQGTCHLQSHCMSKSCFRHSKLLSRYSSFCPPIDCNNLAAEELAASTSLCKAPLNCCSMRLLDEVPSVTWPRLRQAFTKSSLSQSTLQVLLCQAARRSGWSDWGWPHGAFNWLVSLWHHRPVVGQCFRRNLTDMQKAEKEITSLTEDEVEVSTKSAPASVDTVGPIWSQLQE